MTGQFGLTDLIFRSFSLWMGQVAGGWIVQQGAALREAGAVAGTVPGAFLPIPFQRAAHVGASGTGECEQVGGSLQPVESELRPQCGAGGGEDRGGLRC